MTVLDTAEDIMENNGKFEIPDEYTGCDKCGSVLVSAVIQFATAKDKVSYCTSCAKIEGKTMKKELVEIFYSEAEWKLMNEVWER